MHNYERFSNQMEETLRALREAIQNLNVPVEQKDKLLSLVRNLRQYAYQAGKAEALANG